MEENYIEIDTSACIECGCCESACVVGAIQLNIDGTPEYNPEVCIGCGACEMACLVGAISVK